MLTRNQIKFIQSLKQKKNRQEHAVFVVEGEKVVQEFIDSSWDVSEVYATADWEGEVSCVRVSPKELERISFLKTPNKVLALVKMPEVQHESADDFVLVLDGVKDPGNLGTIIRLADWFGVSQLYCSKETVDCYNPKVVQATMGSLSRVQLVYADLEKVLMQYSSHQRIAAVMDGESIFEWRKTSKQLLVLGSESHGVSDAIQQLCDKRMTIPKAEHSKAESLNVANACAIALAQLVL